MPKKLSNNKLSEKSAATNSVSLIKGYLPVRLRILKQHQYNYDNDDDVNSTNDEQEQTVNKKPEEPTDESFFYVKEHTAGNNNNDSKADEAATSGVGTTLFVANCPTVPKISTRLLLQSIFGRYGDVSRVTVIPKPSSTENSRMSSLIEVPYVNEPYQWTTKYAMVPTYYRQKSSNNSIMCDEEETGRFAHVVFSSSKEMKRVFRAMQEIMSSSNAGIDLEPIEIQTLSDESDRQWRTMQHQSLNASNLDDFNETDFNYSNDSKSNVQMIEQQYRMNCSMYQDRDLLLQECNAIMEQYEDAEAAAERRQREMSSQPDDDGFVTVSYSTKVTTTDDLEQQTTNKRSRTMSADGTTTATTSRRMRANNTNKKKKKGLGGALPIPDFYRFQTREQKQKSIQSLREQFEQDKLRIQRLK